LFPAAGFVKSAIVSGIRHDSSPPPVVLTRGGGGRPLARPEARQAVQALITAEHRTSLATRAYYRSHAARYTALIRLLDDLPLAPGARALELGCAEGILSAFLRERYGWAPTGVDYFPDAVAKVEARGIPAQVCDVDHAPLPFRDGAFELVLFDSLLEHMYQPARVLAEIRRVLAPGGYLLLGTPNATNLVFRLQALAGRNLFATFNQFNAVEGQAFMRLCAVFYTPREVMAALGTDFQLTHLRYAPLFAAHRENRSRLRNLITPFRLGVCRLAPSLSDFFYLVARFRHEGRGSP
jgi:SAM-dependent methyltransferase